MQRFSKDIIGIVFRLLRLLLMKRCNHNYKNIVGLSDVDDAICVNIFDVNFRDLHTQDIFYTGIFSWVHDNYTGYDVPHKY